MEGMEGMDAPLLPPDDGEGMEGMDGIEEDDPPPPELPEGTLGMFELLPPLEPDGTLGMPELELLPPLDPEDPLDPLDPEEPPELGAPVGGVGMLADCCSAHPPIRKLETAPIAVICAATTSSRWIAGLRFIALLRSWINGSCLWSSQSEGCGASVPRVAQSCDARAERALSVRGNERPMQLSHIDGHSRQRSFG